MWLAPLVEQIRHDPGNIRRLIDHFTSPDEAAIGLRQGANVMFRHLDIVDGYVRLLTGTQRFLQVGYEPAGRIWPGVLLFGLWIAAFAVAMRLRHRTLICLHVVIAVTLALSLVSMSKIFGKIWYYLTLWAWGTTTLMLVAIAWTVVALLADRRPSISTRRVGLIARSGGGPAGHSARWS